MPKRNYDWEAIEKEYRADQISIRAIAKKFGPTEAAIRQRAKKHNWTRDLGKQVRTAVQDNLNQEELRTANAQGGDVQDVVEAAAQRGADVIRNHRTDIRNASELVAALFSELKGETAALHELIQMAAGAEKVDKKLLHALSLPQRASTARSLAGALKDLVTLERKAFNLDEEVDKDGDYLPIDVRLQEFAKRAR